MGQKGGLKHRIVHSEAKCDYHAPKVHNMLEKNEFLLIRVIQKYTFDQSWSLGALDYQKEATNSQKGGLKHKTVNYEAKYDFQVPKFHSLVVKRVFYLKEPGKKYISQLRWRK